MLYEFFNNLNYINISFLILLIILILISNEFFNKKNNEEIKRKIPHIIIGVLLSLTPIFMSKKEIIFSAIIIFIGIWIGKYFKLFKNIFSIKRITLGMWLMPFSLGIMSFLWLPDNPIPFIVGMLVLALSDAFAAIIGKKLGRKKIPFTNKTYWGSFAFFISTFLIFAVLVRDFNLWKIILSSFFLTLIEIVLIFGLDNLFLPIFASTIFYIFF